MITPDPDVSVTDTDCTHINADGGRCPDCGATGEWVPVLPPRYLSAIVPEGECDGRHGRFCPECASVNRGIDRDRARANHPAGKGRKP